MRWSTLRNTTDQLLKGRKHVFWNKVFVEVALSYRETSLPKLILHPLIKLRIDAGRSRTQARFPRTAAMAASIYVVMWTFWVREQWGCRFRVCICC